MSSIFGAKTEVNIKAHSVLNDGHDIQMDWRERSRTKDKGRPRAVPSRIEVNHDRRGEITVTMNPKRIVLSSSEEKFRPHPQQLRATQTLLEPYIEGIKIALDAAKEKGIR